MSKRILLVDDEADLLEILEDFFSEKGYEVRCALNGTLALAALEQERFDLLLSDINMPGMKGFELLDEARRRFPDIKTALITAYDVRDYLQLAKNHNVGNIIAKTTPFNFEEIALLVNTIFNEDVFGLQRYVRGEIHTLVVKNSTEVEDAIMTVVNAMPDKRQKRKFRQVLGEILVNAVYYGAKNERGDRKSEWDFEVPLKPDEEVVLSWGIDQEKAGAAVTDQKGRLTKKEVLYWLERNTTKGSDGLSTGLFDEHGKGLFITRETIDRFIINIKRTVTTEVVMLNYREGLYDGYRPLWIHEF